MITLLYASLLALLLVYLSAKTIQVRQRNKIALGDGGKDLLKQRMRGQANLAEYAPLFLILLFLLEITDTSIWILHVLGVAFLLGRLLHAYAFTAQEKYKDGKLITGFKVRRAGMILTFTSLVSAAGLGLFAFLAARIF